MPECKKSLKFSKIWLRSQKRLRRPSSPSRRRDWNSRVNWSKSLTPSCKGRETRSLRSRQILSVNLRKTNETSSRKWITGTSTRTELFGISLTSSRHSSSRSRLWVARNLEAKITVLLVEITNKQLQLHRQMQCES